MEKAIRDRYPVPSGEGALAWLARNDQEYRSIKDELDYCREVRNFLSHNESVNDDYAVIPSEAMLQTLRSILSKVSDIPKAINICTRIRQLYAVSLQDHIRQAMRTMASNSYAHVPILQDGRVVGVFSESTVLAYLNVGAIEKNRSYYNTFSNITLGSYDGWPNERWINVADVNWQNYVVNTLAKQYISMGFQGFYVDNLDVYYHFETAAIYNGSLSILKRLMAFNRIIMVNGADLLIRRLIAAGTVRNYLNVINQEEVFSTNDGDVQDSDDTEDYKEYLALAKSKGLIICLLEYGTNSAVLSRIQTYANQNGFFYYYAPDRNLE